MIAHVMMKCKERLAHLIDLETPEGKALGRWVNNQRSNKNKGNMRPDREEQLISTGLRWSNTPSNSWQNMMNELKVYIEEKVRLLVLLIHVTSERDADDFLLNARRPRMAKSGMEMYRLISR